MRAETFIELCKEICNKTDIESAQIIKSAKQISNLTASLKGHTHPMITDVISLSFEIAENYRGEQSNREDWEQLCTIVQRYARGYWMSTRWSLIAIYGRTTKSSKINESISIHVSRYANEITIETPDDTLRDSIEHIAQHLNNRQTDEWYLQNLSYLLPKKIDNFQLMDYSIMEMLDS